MSSNKDELRAELDELKGHLVPQLARDKKRVESEGRPFSALSWVGGEPDTRKYPAGPAFLPMGRDPSFFSAISNMDGRDVLTTAAGAVVCYAMGLTHGESRCQLSLYSLFTLLYFSHHPLSGGFIYFIIYLRENIARWWCCCKRFAC